MEKLNEFLCPDLQLIKNKGLLGVLNKKSNKQEMSPKYQAIELISPKADTQGLFSFLVKYKEMFYIGKSRDRVASNPCLTKEQARATLQPGYQNRNELER